jgi:DNA primase
MFFAKDFPDKLCSQILTSEIIGKKVKLKARGKDFLGLCPFHNEKTPSFTVNDQKGFYHCFGCEAHGNIISFTMETKGLAFKEAVIQIAEENGIEIPYEKFDEKKQNLSDRKYDILQKICDFYVENLTSKEGLEAKNYLKNRNLDNQTVKNFKLGFAINSYNSLTNFLKNQGFNENEILQTGVIAKNSSQKLYDKFRNRVIFPIFDKKSRAIAFGGRTLDDQIPKYLNSAETEFFKKNQTLYNLDKARKEIFDNGYVIIVEGYMDVISLCRNGVKNVVASLGTSLSSNHIKELFAITDKIIICLDGDQAGINAAKRASEISLPIINSKKNIKFAILPDKKDPDDFISEFGKNEFINFINNCKNLSQILFDFAILELKINIDQKISAEDKARIEGNLEEKIEKISDLKTKKYFSQYFREILFTLGKGNGRGNGNKKGSRNFKKPDENISKLAPFAKFKNSNLLKTNSKEDEIGKNICAFFLVNPELINYKDDLFDIKNHEFASEKYTNLKDFIIDLIENDDSEILNTLKDSEFKSDIENLEITSNLLKNLENDKVFIKFKIILLKDLLLKIEQQYIESLEKFDEIETHESEITNQKIKELFMQKINIEHEIFSLEKEIN